MPTSLWVSCLLCPNCYTRKLKGHYSLEKVDAKLLCLQVLARKIQNFVIAGYRGIEVAHELN